VARSLADDLVDSLHSLAGVESVRRTDNGLQIELAPEVAAAPIVAALVRGGAEVEEVRREHPTLEEAFLELVTSEDDIP
jgi:hypothetical protein